MCSCLRSTTLNDGSTAVVASLKTRQALVIENLALRQQLAVFERSVNRPRLRATDRLFWMVFVEMLLALARTPSHRDTGHGGALAPSGFSPLLDMEE